MDTKTPPIPLKYQEKKQQSKKKEKSAGDISLPPLTPLPTGNRQKVKNSTNHHWNRETPLVNHNQGPLSKHPYRILHLGATPLMHACQQADRSRVLRLLKEQEETIGYRDRTLRSALHYCMDAGTAGAVSSAAPELVNASDNEGHTPLHLAVIAGDTQLVAVLLANGADVNAKDLEGHSVLHWATVCGEAECVRLVLSAGARPSTPDLRGGSPLHYAAQCCGAAVTAELSVPKKIGLKVLQTLLEFNADVNAKDEDGRQPILWAASAGSVEAVLALARAGGSAAAGATDKDGLTALHCAASRGHARCVEALVNLCGSQPDHVDDNGCSALHYAATLGHADATALLLRLGADPNRQDRKGRTPALCAAAKGQLETLKMLAQHGGSLHARTIRGTGVAHEAVLSGRIELLEWLARKKPSTLDVATHDGRMPLHVAALHGYLDACKILLDNGALINAIFRTSKGVIMTPLDAALYRGHRDCAKLIQMHGGTTSQHLRSHQTAPNRVFAAKVKVKRSVSGSSTVSESEGNNHKDDLYIEEHWIEKRTRRRRRKKKRDDNNKSNRSNRSFSEEKIRNLKSSQKDRVRRAKSESARYKTIDSPEIKKTRRKHEYSESSSSESSALSSSEIDDDDDDDDDDQSSDEKNTRKKRKDTRKKKDKKEKKRIEKKHDEKSLSDDSLEVVVVKRSLEKKIEKVQYSGRKSKTPREILRESRSTEAEGKKNKNLKKSDKDGKESKGKNGDDKGRKKEEDNKNNENFDNKKKKKGEIQKDVTDSTSQEAVERVIVTALVHEADTPTGGIISEAVDHQLGKSDIDHILETADDMQSSLMTKAADLKKDVEEIRRQRGKKVTLDVEEKKNFDEKSLSDRVDESSSLEGDRTTECTEDSSSNSKLDSRDVADGKKGEEIIEGNQGIEREETPMPRVDEGNKKKKIVDESFEKSTGEESRRSSESKSYSASEKEISHGKSENASGSDTSRSREEKSDESKTKVEEKHLKEAKETIKGSGEVEKNLDDSKVERKKSKEIEKKVEESEKKLETSEKNLELSEKKLETSGKNLETSEKNLETLEKNVSDVKKEDEKISKQISDDDKKKSSEIRHMDNSSSEKSSRRSHNSRPSTGKSTATKSEEKTPKKSSSSSKGSLFDESSSEQSPNHSAIIAVIQSPEWDDEDEEVAKEIRNVVGDNAEPDTDPEDNDSLGVLRVLPSTSDEGSPTTPQKSTKISKTETSTQVDRRLTKSPKTIRTRTKQRRDSGGRDSGIEPSPRVSKIPKRNLKCCPNTLKQQALNMETVTRDVQISLRRYHLERKIFFQLMELKRLQIRHGQTNEHVLIKRQVEAFHKAGMSGPALGVARYDQALTFKDFEGFLYEQLRRLQRRPVSPDWCTEAKQCTQKTHRCHHATSAYTSVPIYTYLGGGGDQEREDGNFFPKIENRAKGQMTVEFTKGDEKQIISLPAEKLDRTKRYYVAFTVRGDDNNQDNNNEKSSKTPRNNAQRNTKSV